MSYITKIIILSSFLFISGCGLYTIDKNVIPDNNREETINVDISLSNELKDSLKEASKEDCVKIYIFFSGLYEYLNHINDDEITSDQILNNTLLKVQTQYGWNREKYPNLTNVISKDLNNKNLDEPHKLGDRDNEGKKYKLVLSETFKQYSEIVKTIAESK